MLISMSSLLACMIVLLGETVLPGPGEANSLISTSVFSSAEEFRQEMSYPSLTKLPAPIISTREATERKRLLIQAGAAPSLSPLRAALERPLMWVSRCDPRLGWSMGWQALRVGWVSPLAPIRNELECFILVSDTFLSKHPWVLVMCN